ncbi:hypothetical protein F6R98_06530 [Candidatus Methylospira mobilis]|uniref:Uncharacterized protein n=1 Tax=Candidatus Methylospira mobilis TaxID=1808979 RepID=A0A5Q0BJG7_9GAMM|nr:3'-5' exoribonuclease [Candidatus Methylospira mobilis]QFY42324.1 hypothetical protein F6R98_06530 [Candidatus Methylospira mobilis]
MRIFIDTEFTDFNSPALISIALVTEDGHEFYAERTDYSRDACNKFVRTTVLPLLGRVPGAACNQTTLTKRLHTWFAALSEPATIVCDFEGDWLLLNEALLCGGQKTPPVNMGEKLLLDSSIFNDPVFGHALNRTFTQKWPPHHALADARALRAGHRAWYASMEQVWAAHG